MKCREIIERLEETYPRYLAAPWDNPGLLAGRRDKEVKTVYIALDATKKVLRDAIDVGTDLLLTHHPMLMGAVKSVNTDDFTGQRLVELIQKDISYYAMHTNHDVVTMAPLAAGMLKLQDAAVLEVTYREEGREEGFGRVGKLPQAMTLRECGEYVKEIFGLETVKIFGNLEDKVSLAAVSPGSGKSMVESSVKSGADVLISGDFGHHDGIDAVMQGLSVIDAGHYGLEHIFICQMSEFIRAEFPQLQVYCEEIENPFTVI